MRDQRRLQSGLLAFIKCDYEIDFHKKRARGWSPETSELSATPALALFPRRTKASGACVAEVKSLILEFRSLHLDRQVINSKAIVKFGA